MENRIRNILNKGKAVNCSSKELQEMLTLFHQPDKEFELKEKLREDLLSETSVTNNESLTFKILFDKIWTKVEKKQRRENNKLHFINNIIKVAAAIIVGLVIGILINYSEKPKTEPIYYVAHAPKGSVSEIILPDSSVIFLNADSKIKYSIEGKDGIREIFLEGEAWFDVQKNKNKPFLVHTPFYNVSVTGTQFNIKAYEIDNELTTTLEKGQIVIQPTDKFNIANDIIMNPGEQAVLNKDSNRLTIKNVNPKYFTSWKDNKLIFINMNLKELVVLLERKYGVNIEIKNYDILDLHFDGTIKNESIIEFLEIIKSTLPINYKITGQKIEITYKN